MKQEMTNEQRKKYIKDMKRYVIGLKKKRKTLGIFLLISLGVLVLGFIFMLFEATSSIGVWLFFGSYFVPVIYILPAAIKNHEGINDGGEPEPKYDLYYDVNTGKVTAQETAFSSGERAGAALGSIIVDLVYWIGTLLIALPYSIIKFIVLCIKIKNGRNKIINEKALLQAN